MKLKKHNQQLLLSSLAVSLITASVTTVLLQLHFCTVQFQTLGNFCGKLIRENQANRQVVFQMLKSELIEKKVLGEENILPLFGYRPVDFWYRDDWIVVLAGIGFVAGVLVCVFLLTYRKKKQSDRIDTLTNYLEKINRGGQGLILETSEDEFSALQDEIYKTVTALYMTREKALTAKRNFAENLSNIAHQLKTPITSISLLAQMKKEASDVECFRQIKRQADRLTNLSEALLLLSRVDAGTLVMKRKSVDVFTLLTLASDNLMELFLQAEVSVDIPENGEVFVNADLEWSMEAVMNLLKNCMEHTPPGSTVHCAYEKNPLFVKIVIWDEGAGFSKEDLPHLFERFYRGKTERSGGIGIGLSLAKAIIELQNGIIHAYNLPSKSACFEIRFYERGVC